MESGAGTASPASANQRSNWTNGAAATAASRSSGTGEHDIAGERVLGGALDGQRPPRRVLRLVLVGELSARLVHRPAVQRELERVEVQLEALEDCGGRAEQARGANVVGSGHR